MKPALLLLAVTLCGCVPRSPWSPGPPLVSRPHQSGGAEQWYDWTPDHVRLFVYEFGHARAPGDTVIVLHGGWGAEHSYLLDAVAPLAGRYRFVLYDQRGSLRSPAPDSVIKLDAMVADLEQLRRDMGVQRLTILAHSMGNVLAYAYLAAHPERVRGLVLMDAVLPAPEPDTPAPFAAGFIRQVWPQADSAALAAATSSFYAGAWARAAAIQKREGLVPDSLVNVPPDSLDLWSVLRGRARTRAWRISFAAVNSCSGDRWREMQGGQVFYKQGVGNAIGRDPAMKTSSLGFWNALHDFQGPVRVLMGNCDFVDVGPAIWPHLVAQLHDARLRVVPGGHVSWLEHPREFRTALSASLAEATR